MSGGRSLFLYQPEILNDVSFTSHNGRHAPKHGQPEPRGNDRVNRAMTCPGLLH